MFGPYRLDALIGRGGMGEVHRAYDTVRKRVVALKRLPPAMAADLTFQNRFRRESEIAARLREPHVIPIHDYGEIDNQLYIDMRLVDGIDLATLVERHGPLEPARAVDIVSQVAGALDAAHDDGLAHRDVKPSNVLVTGAPGAEFVYLIDFGIARDSVGTALTTTGATIGTIAYLAPERFTRVDREDHRIDVYALGCVLYQALTGRAPFHGEPSALMYAHINSPPPRPSATRPELPGGLDIVVTRAMAKAPGDRFGRASELAGAARDVLRAGRTTVDLSRQGPPPPRWRRWLPAAGVAGVVVLVAGVVVFAAWNRPDGSAAAAVPGAAPLPGALEAVVTGSIVVGDLPGSMALTPDGRMLYVANYGDDSISVIDTTTGAVTAGVTLDQAPDTVTVAPDGSRVYVVSSNIPGAVVDGEGGVLDVIDAATSMRYATAPLGESALGIAITPDNTRLYISNAASASVTVLETAGGTLTATIPVGETPRAVAISPDGTRAYVANLGSDTVSVIETFTGRVAGTVPVGDGPHDLAVAPDGLRVYVVQSGSDALAVIDTATMTVTGSVPVGEEPTVVLTGPDASRVYVVNRGSGSVTVIGTRDLAVLGTIAVGRTPDDAALAQNSPSAVVHDERRMSALRPTLRWHSHPPRSAAPLERRMSAVGTTLRWHSAARP